MLHRSKGFTVAEVLVVSGLMAFLAALLSSAWIGVARPTVDLIGRSQLVQEMNLAVAALSRDLGGSLGGPVAQGGKTLGRWVDWKQVGGTQLWLCFDGGTEPDGQPDWGISDTVIIYQLDQSDPNALVRIDLKAGTTFTVARNVESMTVAASGTDALSIALRFTHGPFTRTCTLVAKAP
jgi:hypothetical protein